MDTHDWQKNIRELVILNNEPNSNNKYFVSAYIANDESGDDDFKTKIKSKLTGVFKENKDLNQYTKFPEKIINNTYDYLNKSNGWENGLGLFFKINPDKDKEEVEFQKIISLNRRPSEEIVIGRKFAIDQLIWMEATLLNASILVISDNEAKIYHLNENEIDEEKIIINDFGGVKKGKSGTLYGETKDDANRAKENTNRNFLNHIIDNLKTDIVILNTRYLVVLYSNYFENIIEKFKDEIENEFLNLRQVKLINKIPVSIEEIKQEATKTIREGQSWRKIHNLMSAKENFRRFVSGWEEVGLALRRKQVEKLFIRTDIKKKGYILMGEFVYINKIKGAEEVNSLGPWMVNDVIKNGGEVFVFNKDEGKNLKNVAALLRY